MRRLLFYLVFSLSLAIGVYLGVGTDSYVLIRLGGTALQMTIWLAIILAFLLILALHLLWLLISGALLGGWRRAWLRHRMDQLIASAVKNYTDQNWSKAYKQLVKLANSHEEPQPYILMAAEAAVASGDIDCGRQTYSEALKRFPENSFQVRLRLAYLELGIGNHAKAEGLCEQLVAEKKRDPDARLLQILVAEDNGDWEKMHELLSSAKSHKVLTARLPVIERRYLRACLAENPAVPQLVKLADLAANGKSVPAELSIGLAQQLAMKGSADRAEQFLCKRIEQEWKSSLVSAYADIEGRSTKAQLKKAESWLGAHAGDKDLLESLVKLSTRSGDQQRLEQYEKQISAL